MATMFLYERYNRLFGIRRLGALENPKVRPIAKFALPRGTVLHYMPVNETELGPENDHPFIKAAQRLVFIDHVPDLLVKDGNPRSAHKPVAPMIQKYRREHMLIRPVKDYVGVTKDLINMVVVNYSLLGQLYRYQRSALSRWWYWKNIRSTMWEKLNQLKSPHERHHIVVLDVPQSLPALSDLRKAEKTMTPMLMKVFNTRERLDLLDLWTWLGPNRERSAMSRLDESRLHEIDLLIRRETGFLTINLGLLNSWRKADAGVSMESLKSFSDIYSGVEFDFDTEYDRYLSLEAIDVPHEEENDIDVSMEAAAGFDPKILQLRFLKMLTRVIAQTSTVQSEEDPDLAREAPDQPADDEEARLLAEEEAQEQETIVEALGGTEDLLEEVEEELAEELDEPGQDNDLVMTDEDGELVIEAGQDLTGTVNQVVGSTNIEHSLTSTIQEKIDELVDKDLYTAAQYRRMQRLAESYKTLPNPWGVDATIEYSLPIKPEDLVLGESDSYPEMDAVRDDSMLQSSVEKMDSQYIEKVMRKDILNAVMSVQKAGIAVTGYKVETVKDAVSHYEIHKIQLTPVTGKPSTISFRVPVIDKHGVYISNGQRYRQRTQKSD